MHADLFELKQSYRIAAAWRDLGLSGEPGKSVRSPLREDHSPSFSVFEEGMRWKDFATGEGGDLFDFVQLARGCSKADAIAWVKDRLGISSQPKPQRLAKTPPKLPPLRAGTPGELRELAERRGFTVDALNEAHQRGFLFFCSQWGQSAWCITDSRRELHEFRRVDGDPWPAYGRLPKRKCHCIGTGKSWPIGTLESKPFPKIAWMEGGPDFVAAIHLIQLEEKQGTVAPVGILGAANHTLDPDALARFKGKDVRMFPHLDDAGRKAAQEWARQLTGAGAARVEAFDLSGITMVDGCAGKDLNDLLRLDPDCWERTSKFRGDVMP